MKLGAIANQLWQFLQFPAALGLHVDQLGEILKMTIGNRFIAQFPQVLGRL
jgi:hypothetical protein